MIRTYTYKLYRNERIERKFEEWLGICRYVYNAAKETKDYAYKQGVNLSGYDLAKQLTECKKEEELQFIKTVGSQTLQGVIERLDLGYKKFYSDIKKGIKTSPPHWAKKGEYKSFRFKQGNVSVTNPQGSLKQTDKGFKLPKFGNVKVHNNRVINGKIKTANLIRKADGIYLNVVAEVEDKTYCNNDSQVGIDMGIIHFLTTSDAEVIPNPQFLEKQLSKLRIEQRKLARCKKGSNRRKRQVKVVARLHKKVTDARKDFLHKTSTYIATNYSDVVIEDLNIKGMVRSNLSRHISDVSWGTFFTMLEYKCNNLVKVNPKNTSRECSNCGHTSKDNRLTQSQFKCVSCGHEANADVDAAKVILGRAFPDSTQSSGLPQACTVESPLL